MKHGKAMRAFMGGCMLTLAAAVFAASAFSAESRLTLRDKATGNPSAQIEVGDTLMVEVFVSVDTIRSQGVSFYVTFDDSVFSLVDRAAAGDTMVRPFDFTGGKYGDRWNENEVHEEPNSIAGYQVDGSIVNTVGYKDGDGVVAVLTLVSLKSSDSSAITLDYDLGEHRDTRLHVQGAGSEQFKIVENMSVSVGTVSGIRDSRPVSVPGSFTLHQNYPNPFNPATKIEFSLLQADNARLEVFDAAGRLVRTLISGGSAPLAAGDHAVTWNGRDDAGLPVASGVYFYRLTVRDTQASRKMLLVR